MCQEAKTAYLRGLVGEDPGCLLGLMGAQGSFAQPDDERDACSEAVQSDVCYLLTNLLRHTALHCNQHDASIKVTPYPL